MCQADCIPRRKCWESHAFLLLLVASPDPCEIQSQTVQRRRAGTNTPNTDRITEGRSVVKNNK